MVPDEYESVLGIPPGSRPPDHYELLGLDQFEADHARIEAAYEARVALVEQCSTLPGHRLRPLMQELYLAKACLLGEKSKADYDRHLTQRISYSSSILLLEPPIVAPARAAEHAPPAPPIAEEDREIELDRGDHRPEAEAHDYDDHEEDGPHFEQPEFGDVSIAGIGAERKGRAKKPKSRRLFWIITGLELVVVVGLFLFLRNRRQAEPEPPQFVVRQRTEQPGATNTPAASPTQTQRQSARRPARDPIMPADSPEPPSTSPADPLSKPSGTAPSSPGSPPPQASLPPKASPGPPPSGTGTPEAPLVVAPPDGSPAAASPPGQQPAPAPGVAPAGPAMPPALAADWTLRFAASGDWALDGDMLVLSADDKKAIAALVQQDVFTLRDTSTKKPIAVLQYDNEGHATGIAAGRSRDGEYRIALKFNDGALAKAWVWDEAGHCVWFGEYRGKNHTKAMFSLIEAGAPVVVQISKGKDADAYWIDRQQAKPVAVKQSDLLPPQAEQLDAALNRLTTLEKLVRDSEKEWKGDLKAWSKKSLDSAQRQKPAARDEFIRKLKDEQHVGIDKLLGQF